VDGILTPETLAARYGLAEKTLTDWRYRGTGPRFFRAGKRVFYREADVLAWETRQADEQAAKRAS
jgi:predicted DNA-binding transcriptional regulator AlpA